ncbi:PhnD/SsuA/transferrin family substrate-binding protein [Okeania sp.]|uniref:phosphate/phosphite/phosphonate ABC transporter substrate-binding protein n=1 Tax=Okeania sp. TaxID=3100323 RepID=UPI002B4B5559|nr:PhnD/SsuA/transferrin family substrate-binding protein [Okeania sp.]MEB3341100.1 PhnD/SsuA/transferrin family substrate-binding protein [Okeania sp.]
MLRRHFLWYFFLSIAGCTTITDNRNFWLQNKKKLLFAVSDVQGLAELEQEYGQFITTLADVLETKIEFFPVNNLVDATTALQLDEVDLIHVGPSEYVIIRARTNAIPIVALTRLNYRAIIAVRANSGIKSLADLKGKTIELGEIGITGNHIAQIKMLIDAGLNPLSDVKIINSEDYQLKALKNGEVDAWGRVLHRYKKTLGDEGLSQKDYPILIQGELLPSDVFLGSGKLEPMLVDEIRQRMLANQDILLRAILSTPHFASKFTGSTFTPVNDSDYDMIREVYKAMGNENFIK